MNLYQISAEYQQILDNLYDEEGNVNEQELIKLEKKDNEINEKAVAIASYIKNMEAERIAIENAKKEMIEREKRYKKKIDRFENDLKYNMERCGIVSIKHSYFEIKLKKCRLSVDDDKLNMEILPDEYKRSKTEVSADKLKILEHIKVGVVIPGVHLKQNIVLEIK